MARVASQVVTYAAGDRDEALLTVIRQMCLNPLRALRLPAPGLAPGAPADLVVLTPNLAVQGVMRKGAWAHRPTSS